MYPYKQQLLIHTEKLSDTALSFDLDNNLQRWPWQALPAWHPALAGKISFFTGFKCGEELFAMPSGAATAVTLVRWQNSGNCLLGEQSFRGRVSCGQAENRFHYDTELLSADGALQQTILAQGVEFQQRDFDGWRRKMKQALQSIDSMRPADFG
ncbi:MAG: hypothetical protein ACPHER_00045, partial [Nevskiales bacterium]